MAFFKHSAWQQYVFNAFAMLSEERAFSFLTDFRAVLSFLHYKGERYPHVSNMKLIRPRNQTVN